MNFEELQMKRESCRVYADRPVTREQLVQNLFLVHFCPLCPQRLQFPAVAFYPCG